MFYCTSDHIEDIMCTDLMSPFWLQMLQYIYERVYSFCFKITLQSVTFLILFKVSCLRQTNLQDSNLLTIHVDICSQKGLIKSVEHKLFTLVQHGWSFNCSKQSNCSRQMLHEKSRFYSKKNHIFSNFRGGARRVQSPPPLNPPLELVSNQFRTSF
jgi:hypothetical protein